LIAEIGTAPGAARAREIEQALRRLSDLSEKLLQISRMDTGLGATDTAIDLLPALDLVVHDFRSVVRSPELINYQRPSPGRLTAPMDLDAFAIVMRNLLENAIKHGKPDTPIDIAIDGAGALVVGNESELIASEQLQQLSRRFARGATEAAGSGLGLAIVETIMRQSGGELTLRSPRAGRADGFEAVLILPR
jgi:two-component system OmpR family sensor kinase